MKDDLESLNNIAIINKLNKRVPTSRKKKLAKEIKNHLKKVLKKLLILLIN